MTLCSVSYIVKSRVTSTFSSPNTDRRVLYAQIITTCNSTLFRIKMVVDHDDQSSLIKNPEEVTIRGRIFKSE